MNEKTRGFFPLFLDMRGKTLLFVGGGKIAERRIASFLSVLGKTSKDKDPERLQVIVVAPKVTAFVEEWADQGFLLWKKQLFSPKDVEGAELVLAVTDDPKVNETVVLCCREKKIMVNNGGKKEQCDFYFPGIAVKDELVAGIIASGTDHTRTRKAAQAVRKAWEQL